MIQYNPVRDKFRLNMLIDRLQQNRQICLCNNDHKIYKYDEMAILYIR